jgi:hypothetical protein
MNKLSLAALLLVSACSMTKKDALPTGGDTALSGTMADAPVLDRGDTITSAVACNGSTYGKLAIPAGETFQVEVGIDGGADGCLSFAHLNADGGTPDGSFEWCTADLPRTVDLTGHEGGGYLSLGETGACKGIRATLVVK